MTSHVSSSAYYHLSPFNHQNNEQRRSSIGPCESFKSNILQNDQQDTNQQFSLKQSFNKESQEIEVSGEVWQDIVKHLAVS